MWFLCTIKILEKHSTKLVSMTMIMKQSRAASIVRRDMLKMKLTFNCSFGSDSTPASLLALVSMVLYGASITSQTTVSSTPQPALTISQLLQFSSSACKKVKQSPMMLMILWRERENICLRATQVLPQLLSPDRIYRYQDKMDPTRLMVI